MQCTAHWMQACSPGDTTGIMWYKPYSHFSCTRFEFGASNTFSWIILFPHNFVFLNHNKEKISASTLLIHGRNYAWRSTLFSWPDTRISVLGASNFSRSHLALIGHHFKQFKDGLVGPRDLGTRPLPFVLSRLESGWHSESTFASGCDCQSVLMIRAWAPSCCRTWSGVQEPQCPSALCAQGLQGHCPLCVTMPQDSTLKWDAATGLQEGSPHDSWQLCVLQHARQTMLMPRRFHIEWMRNL